MVRDPDIIRANCQAQPRCAATLYIFAETAATGRDSLDDLNAAIRISQGIGKTEKSPSETDAADACEQQQGQSRRRESVAPKFVGIELDRYAFPDNEESVRS